MRYQTAMPAMLLCLTLAGCAGLPPDTGRTEVSAMLEARGRAGAAIDDLRAAAPLIAELAGRPLTARDAIRLALVNNPRLSAEYARIGIAAADVYAAGRLSNPVLSASLLIPDAGGEADQVGFGLAQNFTELLLLPSRSRLAQGEYALATQSIGAAALEIAAATEAAWIRLVGSWQLLGMRQAVAKAASASAELAQRFFAAGNISRLELALQQAAAAEARLAVLDARADITQERGELNRLMGLGATEDHWKVSDRLPAPLAHEDEAAALLALADANRLDLAAARARVALRADALGVTRKFRLLGELEVGVETERETDRVRLTGPAVSLELPIFDQGQGRVARAEASLREAEAELRALEIETGNSVQQAAARVAAAKARAGLYRESLLPLREAIVVRTQEEVNFMLEGQFQLLLVKQQEYDAYQGYLEAVRDYWLARVELARAVGSALPSSAAVGEPTLDAESLLRTKSQPEHAHGAHHGESP